MKKSLLAIAFVIVGINLFAQEQLGLPGDNLNLYSVLDLFQKSETLEQFEKNLNTEELKINNLDLDGDGRIDYIKVVDHVNGTAHAIVLQDAINPKETQDVAVIEVERNSNNQINIQIVGDEALYGKDYIVESNASTPNPGYAGGGNSNYSTGITYPIVNFMYTPDYVVYVSPYSWGYYPSYWNPWHPLYYDSYYGYHFHAQDYYTKCNYYRSQNAHEYYGPHRTTSVTIINKYPVNPNRPSHPAYYQNTRSENERINNSGNTHHPSTQTNYSNPNARPNNSGNNYNHSTQTNYSNPNARPENHTNQNPNSNNHNSPPTQYSHPTNTYSKQPTHTQNTHPSNSSNSQNSNRRASSSSDKKNK